MPVTERDRHVLWNRLEDALGEDQAATLMELLHPAVEALAARRGDEEPVGPRLRFLSVSDDLARHQLWRKLDQVLGSESAWTLIQLWDEASRQTGTRDIRAA